MSGPGRQGTLRDAVRARMVLAEALFAALHRVGFDGTGITRAPYGERETAAHEVVRNAARELELEVWPDHAQNTHVRLAGSHPERARVIVGSHLDSVVCGGNYDGAAGVVAGLVILAAFRDSGWRPQADIEVVGLRAEEGDWFGLNHIGTRAGLGTLTRQELEAARVDTGRSLADHMRDAGCDLEAIAAGIRSLDPSTLGAYFELHIEQGPVLEQADRPVGIVTGIRGSVRCHAARCIGTYAHSGAVPMNLRRDAVRAVVELAHALYEESKAAEAASHDLVLTFGKFFTDAQVHQLSKVPGLVQFTIDARSTDPATLDHMANQIRLQAERIERQLGVTFDLGALSFVAPAQMAPALVEDLVRRAQALDIRTIRMASGAGHDAADFARQGVPTAMIFVRNSHGSHNPMEEMSLEDFHAGTGLLAEAVAAAASSHASTDSPPRAAPSAGTRA